MVIVPLVRMFPIVDHACKGEGSELKSLLVQRNQDREQLCNQYDQQRGSEHNLISIMPCHERFCSEISMPECTLRLATGSCWCAWLKSSRYIPICGPCLRSIFNTVRALIIGCVAISKCRIILPNIPRCPLSRDGVWRPIMNSSHGRQKLCCGR